VSVGTGRSSLQEGRALAARPRSSNAPVVVAARPHAATAARTGRCGSGSRPSSPAGRCAAPAAAASSIPVSRGTSATPTARGRVTTEQSTRPAIEARLERRGTAAGCPIARIRTGAKNARERRGRGSLGWLSRLGAGGSKSRERASPYGSPPRSRSLRLAREREAGVRGYWLGPNCQRRRSGPTVQCPPPWTPWLSAE
jgi:hypothetical protein